MEDIIQFLEENQKSEAGGTKEIIYVNPNDQQLIKYAYKDKEYTEKYSKKELLKAYEQGAIINVIDEYVEYFTKPIYLKYFSDEIIKECGDAIVIGGYIARDIQIASEEYIEPEIG